ncbi:hypothetical protein MSAN_01493800 [Mycena sanguinolenta]|uniref:Uncharacterized protein n=1 Tax=Mycena sanguinolenta TaxID=230812 RepID=A0A8H6YCE1_9AGAR|nr:hypothetical protein MSAN_01493800 [Mycena sanguinolenta]
MTRAIFRILSLVSLVLVQLSSTAAAPAPDTFVTLVDPIAGSDLFPIPASVVGVDAQGRTTFAYAVTATTTTELETATLTEHVTIVAATNYFSVKDELAGPGGTFAVAAVCTQQRERCSMHRYGSRSRRDPGAHGPGSVLGDVGLRYPFDTSWASKFHRPFGTS